MPDNSVKNQDAEQYVIPREQKEKDFCVPFLTRQVLEKVP